MESPQGGAKVRAVRESQGRTQAELASKARVSQAYLCRIEKGLQSPSPAVALRLAEVLGLKAVAQGIRWMWGP